MEGLQQWAFSLCAAITACGLCRMLLPGDRMDKVFRVTISVFFLCCLLSPVVLRRPELKIQLEQSAQQDIDRRAADLARITDSQTQDLARANLEQVIGEKLDGMGIKHHAIIINMNTNGQSGPQVESVHIQLDASHEGDHAAIHDRLERDLGLTVRLGYPRGGSPKGGQNGD